MVALLAGCTGDGDTPPTPTATESAPSAGVAGDRVAVVVGPPSHVSAAEADALEQAARGLTRSPPDGIDEVRVVRAENPAFTADLVELFVDDGFDLVCVVGTGAAPLLVRAAREHRSARLCGTDAAVEGGPQNVVAAALDPVALTTLAAAAVERSPAPVGLAVGPEVGGVDLVEPLLSSLLPQSSAASPGSRPTEPSTAGATGPTSTASAPVAVVAAATDQDVTNAVEEVAAAGATAVVVLAPRSTDGVAALARRGIRSVVVDDWTREDPDATLPTGVLLAITVDRAEQLRAAIGAARSDDPAQVLLLRLDEGVFDVLPGSGEDGAAAEQRARRVLLGTTAG